MFLNKNQENFLIFIFYLQYIFFKTKNKDKIMETIESLNKSIKNLEDKLKESATIHIKQAKKFLKSVTHLQYSSNSQEKFQFVLANLNLTLQNHKIANTNTLITFKKKRLLQLSLETAENNLNK